jgi:hypothetical protein
MEIERSKECSRVWGKDPFEVSARISVDLLKLLDRFAILDQTG